MVGCFILFIFLFLDCLCFFDFVFFGYFHFLCFFDFVFFWLFLFSLFFCLLVFVCFVVVFVFAYIIIVFCLILIMAKYNKGANAERELIKILDGLGFAVLRVAGSGVNPLPCPDVVALLGGKIIAFECKARKGNYLSVKKEQLGEEVGWAEKAGAKFLVAWKVPNKGWLFVDKKVFRLAGKSYMLSLEEAKNSAITFEDLLKF